MIQKLNEKIKLLPNKPGCYLWKDRFDNIIYIGKAKNLAKRIKTYLTVQKKNAKTFFLQQEIYDFDYIIVANENDSLLLESNLITKYKPKYNILLRESNNFPYIVITQELHPRILYVLTKNTKIKGKYYGPFAHSTIKKYELYNFINRIFPLRKCNKLPQKKCLYYDIGQCLGPCIKPIDLSIYQKYLKMINDFFSGNINAIDQQLKKKELVAAAMLCFEESAKYRDLRKNLVAFSQKQNVILANHNNADVVGFHFRQNAVAVIVFKYLKGQLLSKYDICTLFYEQNDDIIASLIFEYYTKIAIELPQKVYLAAPVTVLQKLSTTLQIPFFNPQKGFKKIAIDNAVHNAIVLMRQKYYQLLQKQKINIEAWNNLKTFLGLSCLNRIEIFDNAFLSNDKQVGVMVVYENGVKNKSAYLKFKIKNPQNASDGAFMYEIIYRRYLKKEKLPDLIILDGGVIQLKAAQKALQKLMLSTLTIIALTKDQNHKTDKILLSNGKHFVLDRQSDLYVFLLSMQEEVHRFALSFFHQQKNKAFLHHSLLKIKNLGKKRLNMLLEKYKTPADIIKIDVHELSQIVPLAVAKEIKKIKI